MTRRRNRPDAQGDDSAAEATGQTAPVAAEANGQEKKTPVWKMSVPAARNEWVSCCVWENQAGNGENQFTVYAVQLEVRYKVGEEWRSGHSLRGSHIPLACWLLGKAYDHIQGLRAQVPF